MSDPDDIDAWLDANAALLGLTIEPEWRGSIKLHLRITRDLARRVLDFSIADETDPAPVFRP